MIYIFAAVSFGIIMFAIGYDWRKQKQLVDEMYNHDKLAAQKHDNEINLAPLFENAKLYRARSVIFDAVRVIDPFPVLVDKEYITPQIGDWIVRSPEGNYTVCTDIAFHKHFYLTHDFATNHEKS